MDDLLSVGAKHARDICALSGDVAAVLFPSALARHTEATLSAAKLKLIRLVSDIEDHIMPRPDRPHVPTSWHILAQSGFLREPDIVDFILARVSEDRLEQRIGSGSSRLVIGLLDDDRPNVAASARMLLAADSLNRRSDKGHYQSLPAELLHKIAWRVVAALEVEAGARSAEIIAACNALLAGYDEAVTIGAAAKKVVHLLNEKEDHILSDIETTGLHLHVAAIASALELDHDHVLRLMDAASAAPYAVILAAMGVGRESASRLMMKVRGEALTAREASIFDVTYDAIGLEQARAEVAGWALARAQYLAFGQP